MKKIFKTYILSLIAPLALVGVAVVVCFSGEERWFTGLLILLFAFFLFGRANKRTKELKDAAEEARKLNFRREGER